MGFIYSQLFASLPSPTYDYTGKTIIVTGSNVGLGKEAARHFTRLGASTVILAVRSIEKGEAAKCEIESSTRKQGIVKVMHLDMSSYQSVLDFSAKASKELDRIDVALLNAGVARGKWELAEGEESTVTVNVIATFLLALSLLSKLKDTAEKFNTRPNLTITTSEVHAWAAFEERKAPDGKIFETLSTKPEKMSGAMEERYQVSKLLEVLAIRALAEKKSAPQLPITINCVNPGLCHSELAREAGWGLTILKFFLARSAELGSRNLVHAASLGPESHGQYVSDCVVTQPSKYVLSQEGWRDQQRVWNELAAKLERIQKGITSNL
ncbi:short chain dehydrogenase [Macroventuria anomochaeta]|uniref:Short chain dehydrogenase n=1 Tax=Macroventuria anomochaeta TaxID=301207 RepID=A0ACB6S1J1_9PLEO|nr:short chain dehydrogenase [Macroventuria anomochaeta]KAF2627903.1 short chain dehydrogenase [Macroventuria anomochaeta]